MTFEISRRLYLTEDDRVVSDGDPDARWLYATPGRRIPVEEAEKYGLVNADPFDDEVPEDSQDFAPDEKSPRKSRRKK